jgi:ABC-2 type transport system ATP-binding protein
VSVLSANALSRSFGSRLAVRDVSFAVETGERVAVVGPNGAGKTTLLSMLAGALEPSSGSVARLGERATGWVPQQAALYRKLTVLENLRLFARLEGVRDVDGAVSRMLEVTGLAGRAGEQVARLSGGNQQRVNIAIGLLADPTVLLLDEPSSALDPRQRERLWEFVDGLVAGGTAVLYSTHHVLEAERYAQRVLVMADGELLFDGSPDVLAGAGGGGGFEAAFVNFLRDRGH